MALSLCTLIFRAITTFSCAPDTGSRSNWSADSTTLSLNAPRGVLGRLTVTHWRPLQMDECASVFGCLLVDLWYPCCGCAMHWEGQIWVGVGGAEGDGCKASDLGRGGDGSSNELAVVRSCDVHAGP